MEDAGEAIKQPSTKVKTPRNNLARGVFIEDKIDDRSW